MFRFRKRTIFGWSNYSSRSNISTFTQFVDHYMLVDGAHVFEERCPHEFRTEHLGGHIYKKNDYKTGVKYWVDLYDLPQVIGHFENDFSGSGGYLIRYRIVLNPQKTGMKYRTL